MKLLIVTSIFPYSSAEPFLRPEISSLIARGHIVYVAPLQPGAQIPHENAAFAKHTLVSPLFNTRTVSTVVRQHRRALLALRIAVAPKSRAAIRLKNLATIPKALWLAERASDLGIDHIHCHWAGCTATAGMIAAQCSGIGWSFTAHRWDIAENNLFAVKAASAEFVRFISDDGILQATEQGYLQNAQRVCLVHMGVSVPPEETFGLVERPKSHDLPIVVCPAHLIERKGHYLLFEAMERLVADWPNLQLWLAGRGPLEKVLRADAIARGLEHNVRFLGQIPNDELLGLYKTGRVAAVVLPSLHEGIPVALIEAMSFAIPVIGSDVGGTRELLANGGGTLIRPGDACGLAEGLADILRDPSSALVAARRGRDRVKQAFDIETITGTLERLYEGTELVQSSPSSERL